MFSFEYDFFPADLENGIDRVLDTALYGFLAELSRKGYIIGREWNLVPLDDRLRLFCIAPTEDALELAQGNLQASTDLKRVLKQSRRPPSFRLLGPALGSPICCSCENPGWYILLTNFIETSPPVRCGDCGQPVPLYRLPTPEGEQEHSSILGWEAIYQACDTLFMQSGVGEEWGYRQMADLESDLTSEGRRIGQAMADRTGRPWYYYLDRYDEQQEEVCPGCGQPWELDKLLHNLYQYRCDRCCLLSVEPEFLL